MTQPAPLWRVVGQTPTTKVVAGSLPVEGMDVHFVTDKGIESSVFVAKNQLGNIDGVRALINQAVDNLHNIADLTP